jgi:hypothetical protein
MKVQELTSKAHSTVKDAWLVDLPVTKTSENAKRVVTILNTALANLGDATGLTVTEDDVVDISAEWTAIKSETSLKRVLYEMLLIVDNVGDMSDTMKFDMLSDDTENDLVVLHLHGGGLMYDPVVSKLIQGFVIQIHIGFFVLALRGMPSVVSFR